MLSLFSLKSVCVCVCGGGGVNKSLIYKCIEILVADAGGQMFYTYLSHTYLYFQVELQHLGAGEMKEDHFFSDSPCHEFK